MSRSKKKNPITGISNSKSEKQDKRKANRQYRRKTKQQVGVGKEELSLLREESNVWSFDKDGKMFLKNPHQKELRK